MNEVSTHMRIKPSYRGRLNALAVTHKRKPAMELEWMIEKSESELLISTGKISKVEMFARDKMSITLLSGQLGMIRAWSEGKTVTAAVGAGRTTARRVMAAYLQDGLES